MVKKNKLKKSEPPARESPPPAAPPSPGPEPIRSYGSAPGSPAIPVASNESLSALETDIQSSRNVTVIDDLYPPSRRVSAWTEPRASSTSPIEDPFQIKPSESASNVGRKNSDSSGPLSRHTSTNSRRRWDGPTGEIREEEEEVVEEKVSYYDETPSSHWGSTQSPLPVPPPMSQTLHFAHEAQRTNNRVRFQSPMKMMMSPQTDSSAAIRTPAAPHIDPPPPMTMRSQTASPTAPRDSPPRSRSAQQQYIGPPSPIPTSASLNPNARWKSWATEADRLPRSALPGAPPPPSPRTAAAIVAAQPVPPREVADAIIARTLATAPPPIYVRTAHVASVSVRAVPASAPELTPMRSAMSQAFAKAQSAPTSHTLKTASLPRINTQGGTAQRVPPAVGTWSAGSAQRSSPEKSSGNGSAGWASSASHGRRPSEWGEWSAGPSEQHERWGQEWEEDQHGQHVRFQDRGHRHTMYQSTSTRSSPTTSRGGDGSKTMVYASGSTSSSPGSNPPIILDGSVRPNRHGRRVMDAGGAALATANRALFSESRPPEERLHWAYNPNKDQRVKSALAWVHSVSHDVAHLGLQHFLRSRERGALFVNADYYSPSEGTLILDWLPYSELQRTLDRTLQECAGSHDPGEVVIVFVFLLSRSGNSMAIWRRRLAVPVDLKDRYAAEIAATKASVRKEPVFIDRILEEADVSPIPVVVTPDKGKKAQKPVKKRGFLKRLFKRS